MILKDKLTEAIEAKNNDIKSAVWKFSKDSNGVQKEIKLVDATDEQLQQFYDICMSMLYNKDEKTPGRYVLLDIIAEQRQKCNIELFLRKLESGELCADKKPYPRYLYLQDIRSVMALNKQDYPSDKLDEISIAEVTGGLPREFERISIEEVTDGCLDRLGFLDISHITFSFILKMGVCLTPNELREISERDKDGKPRKKPELIKEKLNIPSSVTITVKDTGLSFNELRAMINLKYKKKYSELTTDQLTTLRNKVLFGLENEVSLHAKQWEEILENIRKVAQMRGLEMKDKN